MSEQTVRQYGVVILVNEWAARSGQVEPIRDD